MRDAAPPEEACAIGGTLVCGNPGETAIVGRLLLGEGLALGRDDIR